MRRLFGAALIRVNMVCHNPVIFCTSAITCSSNSSSVGENFQLSVRAVGTHSKTSRERNTTGVSRTLQSGRHELSRHQERDYCKWICGACHFGQLETADEVSRLDHGLYRKGRWAKQRDRICFNAPSRLILLYLYFLPCYLLK